MWLLLTIYGLLFTVLAWKNFRLAIGAFIIGLPAYLIRFKIGPLPTTLLELNFGILFLVWFIKFAREDWPSIKKQLTINKLFFVLCSLFFFSSIVSIFISDMWYYSLGQWRAYFLEPMLVFIMLLGRKSSNSKNDSTTTTNLIWFLVLSTVSIGLFGIAQHFTGWHIGNVDWIALQTGRVTSFFLSPNAVGLFIGPCLPIIAYLFMKEWSSSSRSKFIIYYLLFILGALALITLLLTKSLGALITVGVGLLLFIFLSDYKKTFLVAVLLGGCLVLSTYSLGLIQNKSQSLGNRFTLWGYSWNYLTASPKNFIFGAGIRQFFRKIQKPYYDVKKMERLIYPHNIFLNFWTETGLVGMVSFIVLYCYLLRATWYVSTKSDKILGASLLSALFIILVHGLIDVPYFKNDLAMLFWIIAAITINAKTKNNSPGLNYTNALERHK